MFPPEGDLYAPIAPDPRVTIYRVVDGIELAYLKINGDYGSNPNRSGKYFALQLPGARAFAAAIINAGSTITETSLPQSIVSQGWHMTDPGPNGAGISVYFDEVQLPMVYAAMSPVVIVP
jgi:hypothetical protein